MNTHTKSWYSPTACLQQTVSHLEGGHAKVSDSDVVFLIQEQVLRLQVSVTVHTHTHTYKNRKYASQLKYDYEGLKKALILVHATESHFSIHWFLNTLSQKVKLSKRTLRVVSENINSILKGNGLFNMQQQDSLKLGKLAEEPKLSPCSWPRFPILEQLLCDKNQPDGMTVAEIQSRDDLPEELPGLFRSQPAFLHQVVEQLSSRHMLQHQVPDDI